MKSYNLNKIFVEGEVDKVFIDFLLLKHFQIIDYQLVIQVGGKDNLSKQNEFKNSVRVNNNAKNLIIFDTDYIEKGGGRKIRFKEYSDIAKDLKVNFEIYLLPENNEIEGEVEDLIKTCFNKSFDFFDKCWNEMLNCFEKNKVEKKLNIPAKEGFLFSKIDLFKNFRQNQSWNYAKLTKYDFSDN